MYLTIKWQIKLKTKLFLNIQYIILININCQIRLKVSSTRSANEDVYWFAVGFIYLFILERKV